MRPENAQTSQPLIRLDSHILYFELLFSIRKLSKQFISVHRVAHIRGARQDAFTASWPAVVFSNAEVGLRAFEGHAHAGLHSSGGWPHKPTES